MCDPLSLGALAFSSALSAGGSMLSRQSALDNAAAQADARNGVVQGDVKKLNQYGDAARGLFDGAVGGVNSQNLADAQANRTAAITGAVTPDATPPLDATSSGLTKGAIAKKMSEALSYATDRAKAAGTLGGYGDAWHGTNIAANDAGRNVDIYNNFSKGVGSTTGARADLAAAAAYKPPSIWGSVLGSAGNLLGAATGGGLFKGLGGNPVNVGSATSYTAPVWGANVSPYITSPWG